MSTIIMAQCWPLSIPPTAKAVLISLADNANDDGVCWPSLERICERTCFGRTAVIDAVEWLESKGILSVDRTGRFNRYTLHPSEASLSEPKKAVRSVRLADQSVSRTSPSRGLDQSASRTSQVRQADPNRKEPSRTVIALDTRAKSDNGQHMSTPVDSGQQRTEPTREAEACIAMKRAGCAVVNPSHPDLIAAVAEGCTAQELADAAREAIDSGKRSPFAYAISIARGRRSEGARPAPTASGGPRGPVHPAGISKQAALEERNRQAAREWLEQKRREEGNDATA